MTSHPVPNARRSAFTIIELLTVMGTLDHLRTLAARGIEAAIVGRALYEQTFTLAEALVAASSRD